jgi:integrase
MNQPTGLRLGEAAALRMSDVDVPARRIWVRRSVTYVRKTGAVEGPTKNHTARAARNRDNRPRWRCAGLHFGARRLHTWTMTHFRRLLAEFKHSVAQEPLIPAGATLDFVPHQR